MRYIACLIGLVAANVICHFILDIPWATVVERSYFQMLAVISMATFFR